MAIWILACHITEIIVTIVNIITVVSKNYFSLSVTAITDSHTGTTISATTTTGTAETARSSSTFFNHDTMMI